jgi:uncharacterized protein DUF3997
MKCNIQLILLPFLAILLQGCFGLFDSESDRIVGRYILISIDEPRNRSLSKESELHSSNSFTLIEPYVFAVGHNSRYIIAKQHSTSGFEGGFKILNDSTHYFIVDIYEDRDKIFGPLTIHQFDSLRKELKILDIKFDITYPNNP